jgi:hypothetical protein
VACAVLALAGALAVLHANGAISAGHDLPLSLSWTAPDGCPDVDAVRQQIEQMVHPTAGQLWSEPITARGVVQRRPDGTWNLELETNAGGLTGTRTLSGRGCDDLTRAGALVIALMINSAAPTPEPTSAAPAVEAAPKPEQPPSAGPSQAQSVPHRGAPFEVAAAIDALLSVGQLPGVAEGAGVRLEASIPHLAFQLRGAAWLPKRAVSTGNSAAGGTFDLLDFGAVLCGRVDPRSAFAADLCAGLEAAWMRGVGFGTANPAQSADWWTAALVGGAVRYRLGTRLEARLAVEGWAFPFGRPSFALHDLGTVYAPSDVSGRIALGVQFSL